MNSHILDRHIRIINDDQLTKHVQDGEAVEIGRALAEMARDVKYVEPLDLKRLKDDETIDGFSIYDCGGRLRVHPATGRTDGVFLRFEKSPKVDGAIPGTKFYQPSKHGLWMSSGQANNALRHYIWTLVRTAFDADYDLV